MASEGQILIEGIFRLLLFLYLPRGKKKHVDTIFLPNDDAISDTSESPGCLVVLQQIILWFSYQRAWCSCKIRIKTHETSPCTFPSWKCLIPSHSIEYGGGVSICPVKGCRKTVRKRKKEHHMKRNETKHLTLITEERLKLLWIVLAKVGG